jgi:hypothetical protein
MDLAIEYTDVPGRMNLGRFVVSPGRRRAHRPCTRGVQLEVLSATD